MQVHTIPDFEPNTPLPKKGDLFRRFSRVDDDMAQFCAVDPEFDDNRWDDSGLEAFLAHELDITLGNI
jgi:hypothetical protein